MSYDYQVSISAVKENVEPIRRGSHAWNSLVQCPSSRQHQHF